MGLDFDGEPVVQSQRGAAYAEALATVADQTYPCFCTRREIAEAASAPHGTVGRYPGTCRDLTAAERAERARRPVARPAAAGRRRAQTIRDVLHGEVTGPVDDFVVQRNDGVAAYNLAVVVDDAASGIDQVVRGDDLLPAAINQAYLATAARRPPRRATRHVPLAVNADGVRLAKRDGAVTLADLALRGVSARDVLGLIADSLGLPAVEHVAELLPHFDPQRLPRPPVGRRSPESLTLDRATRRRRAVSGGRASENQGTKVGTMIIWADGEVTAVRASWPGAVELTVARRDQADTEVRALVYTDLMAAPAVGDRVLLNVAALDRGLGTGGYALVIAVLDPTGRVTAQPPQPAGHLVKARYMPLQAMVAGADEQGSPHHEVLADADSLDGLPVLVADLHSALAPRAAGRGPRPPGRPGGLRDDRPGRAAARLLPLGGRTARRPGCWPAR